MGIFDDFTNFMSDMNTIKQDFTELKDDVVQEFTTEADSMKQTVAETATEFKTAADDMRSTIQQSTSLNDPQQLAEDQTDQAS